jgi:hypothetical protein
METEKPKTRLGIDTIVAIAVLILVVAFIYYSAYTISSENESARRGISITTRQ